MTLSDEMAAARARNASLSAWARPSVVEDPTCRCSRECSHKFCGCEAPVHNQ